MTAVIIRDIVLPDDERLCDPSLGEGSALLVEKGRIVRRGAEEDLRAESPDAQTIDGGGGLLVPGFVDGHGHLFSLGEALSVLDLSSADTLQAVCAAVAEAVSRLEAGEWLVGRGWLPDGEARHEWIERLSAAAPEHPVILNRFDHHGALVNAEAARLAGVDETTPDPPGGRIVSAGGRLTGLLLENAADLVRARLPEQDAAARARLLDLASRRCLELGITGVHESVDEPEWVDDFLARTDARTPRVYGMLRVPPGGDPEALAERSLTVDEHPRFEMQRLRLVLDGGLGARGALFSEEYSDEPGNTGLQMVPLELVEAAARAALSRGFRLCVHAIGDRANTQLLDVYERVARDDWPVEPRMVVEHATVVRPDDVRRMARLGVLASVQPNHLYKAIGYLDSRLGEHRRAWAYPLGSMEREGVTMVFGTDFPVATPDPLTTLHAAVTRQTPAGEPEAGYVPDERVTIADALVAATLGGSYMAGHEGRRGRIAPGHDADLVIIDTDVTRAPADRIPSARVTHTLIAGELVFARHEA